MLNRNTRQRILCLLFAVILCLSGTVIASAAEGEQNSVTDAATADTAEANAESAEESSEENEENEGNEESEEGEPEEPERPEPDAYFEPIQTDGIAGWPAGPAVWAESAVVMDLDSGTFLYSKNMDAAKYPASITKIMTTLLAIENSTPNERVTFSENAIFGIERNSSHIGIRVGEILSMEECLHGMMLESANEVCLAVAEHISGSVEGFVEQMNQKAIELGCTNTHFTNPNGLPDENHYTTAHDMALIAQAAYHHKTFRNLCQTQYYLIPKTNKSGEERWLNNHHKMLPERNYAYEGCTGGKTGFTMAALNTLVTFAERNGRRLVCVSLRTNGPQIYVDTASLLDYGFNNFQNITLYCKKTCADAHMLYPSLYFGQPCTIDALRPDTVITIPISAAQDQVETVYSADTQNISHSYLYNQYPVGQESIRKVLFVPQETADRQSISVTPDTSGESETIPEPEEQDGNVSSIHTTMDTVLHVLTKLPVYIYLLIFLLLLLIMIEVILVVKRSRRKKRRRKQQGKGNKKNQRQ